MLSARMASPGPGCANSFAMDEDPRTRNDRPGPSWIVIAGVGAVLTILAQNNPTEADARRFVAERVEDTLRDGAFTVERRSLVIASHYTIKPSAFLETLPTAAGESDSPGELCLIGVFGTFVPCGEKGAIAERLMRDGRNSSSGGAASADASSGRVPSPASAGAPRGIEDGRQRVPPRIDIRRSPSPDGFYPASARRAEIEGAAIVRACVSPDGRVVGDPTIADSSGTPALDSAAVRWARQAVFQPGTLDGGPVEMCTQFKVRFTLTD